MTPVDQVTDAGSEYLTQWREIQINELIEQFQIEAASTGNPALGHAPYIIVTEKEKSVQLSRTPNISAATSIVELGYTSMSPWTAWTRQENNPDLRDKQGIRKYYDMKRQDGAVRGSLRLLKTPIQAARWFIQPASDSPADVKIAKFVHDCLFKGLNVAFSQVLDDVLLMFDYGYMVFEKVYQIKDGKVVFKKLAPRHPLDIQQWVFDDNGGPAGIIMEPFVPFGNINGPGLQFPVGITGGAGPFIPVNKLAIFSLEPEAGDLRGISVLRSTYKHWYYKDTLYKIDAIQKERHGIGVPIIKLPPGYSPQDRALAEELGRNLRTNDRAHIVIPANWEIMFAALQGQPVSCIESINHHNMQIEMNILAPFLDSSAPKEESIDLFFKSTRYLAEAVSDIFNKFIIEQLVDLNFPRGSGYPTLRARRIGEWNDLRTWSFAFRNLVGSNAIIADDPMEDFLRDELDLPPRDPTTARPIIAPAPTAPNDPTPNSGADPNRPQPTTAPVPGTGRQAPTPPMGTGRSTTGRDAGGLSGTPG